VERASWNEIAKQSIRRAAATSLAAVAAFQAERETLKAKYLTV
jgi:hypothetical protein